MNLRRIGIILSELVDQFQPLCEGDRMFPTFIVFHHFDNKYILCLIGSIIFRLSLFHTIMFDINMLSMNISLEKCIYMYLIVLLLSKKMLNQFIIIIIIYIFVNFSINPNCI